MTKPTKLAPKIHDAKFWTGLITYTIFYTALIISTIYNI
jgi:hypothetical protein